MKRRVHFHRRIERLHERQTRELDMTVPYKYKSTCMVRTKKGKSLLFYLENDGLWKHYGTCTTIIKRSNAILFAYFGVIILRILVELK